MSRCRLGLPLHPRAAVGTLLQGRTRLLLGDLRLHLGCAHPHSACFPCFAPSRSRCSALWLAVGGNLPISALVFLVPCRRPPVSFQIWRGCRRLRPHTCVHRSCGQEGRELKSLFWEFIFSLPKPLINVKNSVCEGASSRGSEVPGGACVLEVSL